MLLNAVLYLGKHLTWCIVLISTTAAPYTSDNLLHDVLLSMIILILKEQTIK